mmetsp:Transcript_1113/g.3411  ORF Transcript_1113/g.3411 Transcript_1113/m.3411 type:complete len:545 (+) Transcript_1113:27-1661(+)
MLRRQCEPARSPRVTAHTEMDAPEAPVNSSRSKLPLPRRRRRSPNLGRRRTEERQGAQPRLGHGRLKGTPPARGRVCLLKVFRQTARPSPSPALECLEEHLRWHLPQPRWRGFAARRPLTRHLERLRGTSGRVQRGRAPVATALGDEGREAILNPSQRLVHDLVRSCCLSFAQLDVQRACRDIHAQLQDLLHEVIELELHALLGNIRDTARRSSPHLPRTSRRRRGAPAGLRPRLGHQGRSEHGCLLCGALAEERILHLVQPHVHLLLLETHALQEALDLITAPDVVPLVRADHAIVRGVRFPEGLLQGLLHLHGQGRLLLLLRGLLHHRAEHTDEHVEQSQSGDDHEQDEDPHEQEALVLDGHERLRQVVAKHPTGEERHHGRAEVGEQLAPGGVGSLLGLGEFPSAKLAGEEDGEDVRDDDQEQQDEKHGLCGTDHALHESHELREKAHNPRHPCQSEQAEKPEGAEGRESPISAFGATDKANEWHHPRLEDHHQDQGAVEEEPGIVDEVRLETEGDEADDHLAGEVDTEQLLHVVGVRLQR